ncbi:MAG: trigger factor [Planctomycetaceae bacterium]
MTDDARDDELEPQDADTALAEDGEEAEARLLLDVEIDNVGPCRKHIKVTIPRDEVDRFRNDALDEFAAEADVPGFRKGHVPSKLVERRFKDELNGQVKQKLLVGSLEQISEDYELEPINEPDFDVEQLEIPDEGDFVYEFDVEVRPEFDLPDYRGLRIRRPVGKVSESDVESYLEKFRGQYGELVKVDRPAAAGDVVVLNVTFEHDGKTLHRVERLTAHLKPVLRFEDAELEGFDELLAGARPGDVRETRVTVSTEAERVELRGEAVQARFEVVEVDEQKLPELDGEFLERVGVESEIDLRDEIRAMLERQIAYTQRQIARRQVLEQITASADWDLPDTLVRKQVENALHRERLEMQQAGFTTQQIRSRENELRQHAVSETRQALKEHFVLDRIAEEEEVEVGPSDIDHEIRMMAQQRGESPRRVRARLEKSGVIDNLEAQIRERKAVDLILASAQYEDEELPPVVEDRVEAVEASVCGMTTAAAKEAPEGEEEE